jgi:hypothetical protein
MTGPALYVTALRLGRLIDIGSVPRMGFSARHRGRAEQHLRVTACSIGYMRGETNEDL